MLGQFAPFGTLRATCCAKLLECGPALKEPRNVVIAFRYLEDSILKKNLLGLAFAAVTIAAPALVLLPAVAVAQTSITGDVSGHVSDTTGAAVPGATVVLKSAADNSQVTVKTDKQGGFRASLLRPGSYSVHVEGAGLTADVTGVQVSVGQVASANIIATPAGSNTTVDVSTESPLLQSENADIAYTFTTSQIETLPVPGGDISNLAFSTPGANISTGAGYGNFTSFGLPSTSNLFTTNGSDLMDPYLNLPNSGASNNVLGQNELQEAAVVVNGYTAQYGRLSGAQVNFTTKSGTNRFHGNAVYYWNGTVLNANDWFLKNSGVDRPHAVSNQWGGSIGGPIFKDKLFFFFDDEGLRYVLPSGASTTYVPSTAFQNAVQAHINATQPAQSNYYKNIFSLYSGATGFGRAVASTSADGGCGDFAGTTIGGTTFGPNTPCSVSFIPNNNNINTEQLWSGRIDWNISAIDKINFRVKHDWGVQATSTDPINNAFSANSVQPEWDGQLNETHIFSSSTVNNFAIDSLYYSALFGPPNFAAATATFPTTLNFGDGDGFVALGGTDNAYPSGRNVSQYQVVDDLTITKGKHSLKTGFNFRRYNMTNFAPLAGVTGLTTFNSINDFYNGIISANPNNDGVSTISDVFPAVAQAHYALYTIGAYFQDQYNATPNLSLTLSLRFDRGGNPACNGNCFVRLNGPFESITKGAAVPYNQSILTGQGNAYNDVEKVSTQPRFGFAYTPFGNAGHTVIRGGAGVFADIPVASVLSRFSTNAPNVVSFTASPSGNQTYLVQPGLAGSGYNALSSSNTAFQNGFRSGQTLAQIQAAVAATGSSYSAPNYTASVINTLKNPKFIEWNLEVQQAMGRSDVIDINYVGNYGYNILSLNAGVNAYAACAANGRCPGGFGSLPLTRPDPRFTAVTTLGNANVSNYNGLTASYRHQGRGGLTTAVNYTYSHALDTASNGGVEPYNTTQTFPLTAIDPYDLYHLNYGNADYDTRHNVSLNYVWRVPGNFRNGLLRGVAQGWTLSGTLYDKTGQPFSVVRGALSGFLTNSTNGGSVLGGYLGGAHPACDRPHSNGNPCLITSEYATSATQYLYGFGNQRRNSYVGPGYFDTDAQLSKVTPLFPKYHEGMSFKIGANFFNILNHPNFAPPVNNLALGTFGQIQSATPPVSSPYGNFQGAGVSGRLVQVTGAITF